MKVKVGQNLIFDDVKVGEMVVKILICDIQEKGDNLENAKKAAAVGKGVSSLSEKVFP